MQSFTLCAVGFDHLGFTLRPKTVESPQYRIDFLSKLEFLGSGMEYDGVILPSGIFERHRIQPERDGERTLVDSETDLIQKTEKKIDAIWAKGGWVLILADAITDRVNESRSATIVNDTDLSKRLLNRYQIQRQLVSGRNLTDVRHPILADYAKSYAYIQTTFFLPAKEKITELVSCSQGVAGFSIDSKLYVLPYFRHYSKSLPLSEPIKTLAQCIIDIRSGATGSVSDEVPAWLSQFQFESEVSIEKEKEALAANLARLAQNLSRLNEWKRILSCNEPQLLKLVKEILKDFFGLETEDIPDADLPACRLMHNGSFLGILSVSACEGDISRAQLNEIDSLRERLNLSAPTPVWNILNDHTQLLDFAQRQSATLSREKLEHAHYLRIGVFRSVDFLVLMKKLEGKTPAERAREFLRLLQDARGLIRAA